MERIFKQLVIVGYTAFLAACSSDLKTGTPQVVTEETIVKLSDSQLKNMTIELGVLENRHITSLLKVNGLIDVPPQNLVSISVPMGGFLKSTKLLPGMHVAKGETIAIMEDQQYIALQQEYLTTEVKLKFATAEFNRQRELNQSKASSDKVFQQAEVEYKNLKIALRSLSEKLGMLGINTTQLNENNLSRSITVHSPIDGYVTAVHANIGKYVNPTEVLFELVNPEDIHLALTIFEGDLDKLFIGQKLVTYNNVSPSKRYSCEIILIGKDLSAERSVEVHCHFDQFDKKLIPGMYMNAELEVSNRSANALPDEAVVAFEGKQYVFIATGNQEYKMYEVKTGVSEKGYIEIKNVDAIATQKIVVKGAYTLLMKMKNKTDE